jgi:hypothetical protein
MSIRPSLVEKLYFIELRDASLALRSLSIGFGRQGQTPPADVDAKRSETDAIG